MSWVKNLKKVYVSKGSTPEFSINIPQWEISDEGVTALWGPSGSGKTSVFRLLIGLEPCPGMSWEFKGQDLGQLSIGDRYLGVVFQDLCLFPHMTARENIYFAAKARGFSKEQSQSIIQKWMDPLGLASFWDRKVSFLSGGERQRTALARALASQPQFLFLDEPFSALDSGLKAESRKLVRQVVKEAQIPCLLITHDEGDLVDLADQIVSISQGKLVHSTT